MVKETKKTVLDEVLEKGFPKSTPQQREHWSKIVRQVLESEDGKAKEIVGITPEIKEHFYDQGYRCFTSGNYKVARAFFSLLALYFPLETKYMLAVGNCHHREKQYEKAICSYAAVAMDTVNDPMPYYYMYDCYLNLRHPQEAAFCMGMVLQIIKHMSPKYDDLFDRAQLLLESAIQEWRALAGESKSRALAGESKSK